MTTLQDAKDYIASGCNCDQFSKAHIEALIAECERGLPYGIIDPDYARVFTIARAMAWNEGYAIAMQGSFTRDLDLIAFPWTDRACEAEHLVKRIESATELKLNGHPPSRKPHGRMAWTLLFPKFADPRFVDLSVFPRADAMLAARKEQS